MRCPHCKGDSVLCKECNQRQLRCSCAAQELVACPYCEEGYTLEPKIVLPDAAMPNEEAVAAFAGEPDAELDLSQALPIGREHRTAEQQRKVEMVEGLMDRAFKAAFDQDSEPDEQPVPDDLMP